MTTAKKRKNTRRTARGLLAAAIILVMLAPTADGAGPAAGKPESSKPLANAASSRLPIHLQGGGQRDVVSGIPLEINHQGVVQVNGIRFNGNGDFRFALVDPDSGDNLWTNDGTQIPGPATPTGAVDLLVINGIYNIRLGDTLLANMTAIPSTVFNDDNVVLRIWFDDTQGGGVQQLSPDHTLTSAPYAYFAARATEADTADSMSSTGVGFNTHSVDLVQTGQCIVDSLTPAWRDIPALTHTHTFPAGPILINWHLAQAHLTSGEPAASDVFFKVTANGNDVGENVHLIVETDSSPNGHSQAHGSVIYDNPASGPVEIKLMYLKAASVTFHVCRTATITTLGIGRQ